MESRIVVDGKFLRHGGTVIARSGVDQANVDAGEVFMRDGSVYTFPPDVVRSWFSDVRDDAGTTSQHGDADARVRRVCAEMKREAKAARPAGETFDSDWVDGWAEAVLSALDGKGGDE